MRFKLAGLVAVLGVAILLSNLRADEEKVPLDKVPAVVKDAVKKQFPKAELVSAEKDTEKGKTTYEIVTKNEGKQITVTLTAEGEITGLEKQINSADLPKAVTAALEAKYPKAELQKTAEEVYEVKAGAEKLVSYEVVLTTAEKTKHEVLVSPEGKITKVEDIKK